MIKVAFLILAFCFSLSVNIILGGMLLKIEREKGKPLACYFMADDNAQASTDWVTAEVSFDANGGKILTLKNSTNGQGLWVKLNPRLSNYLWRKLFLEGSI